MENTTSQPIANDANASSTANDKSAQRKSKDCFPELRAWKRCKKCDEVLPIKKFYKHQGKCIDCISEMNKEKKREIVPV